MTWNKNLAILFATVVLTMLGSTGCMGPSGDTPQEQRASAIAMRDHALAALEQERPEVKQMVADSVGYAVFSNFSIHPGLFSFASGYGVLTNKQTGKDTHLKWTRLTIGPGIAVKGFYLIAVFTDPKVMERIEKGTWATGGQAEASFRFGGIGHPSA